MGTTKKMRDELMGTPKKKTIKQTTALNTEVCQDPRIEELTKQVLELQAKLAEIETRERAQDVYNNLLKSTQELQQKIQNLELSHVTLSVKSDLKGFSVRDFPILDLNETVGPEEIDINPVDIKKLFVSEINILIKNYATDINQRVDEAIKENLFPQMDVEYGKFDLLIALEDGKSYQEFMKCR